MKLLLVLLILLTGCVEDKRTAKDKNIDASRSKEACFLEGGVEYQFHEYNFSGTCVYRKEE